MKGRESRWSSGGVPAGGPDGQRLGAGALCGGTGWDASCTLCHAGESWAFPCALSLFDYDFTDGAYRVVKEIGRAALLTAEFTLAEGARVSAEAPYGFWPLEDVPEEAASAELAEGGAVVFTEAGTENPDLAEDLSGQGLPGHPLPAADGPGLPRELAHGHRRDL